MRVKREDEIHIKPVFKFPMDFIVNSKGELLKYNGNKRRLKLPEGIKRVGDGAFKNNLKLRSIKMPHVLTVGREAFTGCANLRSVSMKNVASIYGMAFGYCMKLRHVDLGHSVLKIGFSAFSVSDLREIRLPKSLKYLEANIYEFSYFLRRLYVENIEILTGELGRKLLGDSDSGGIREVIVEGERRSRIKLRVDEGKLLVSLKDLKKLKDEELTATITAMVFNGDIEGINEDSLFQLYKKRLKNKVAYYTNKIERKPKNENL